MKPKKLRKDKPKGEKKYVRINDKTLIEVDISTPDELARERFLSKTRLASPVNRPNPPGSMVIRNR